MDGANYSIVAFQRKCWWDGVEVNVANEGEPAVVVKLWARRVWTLELSLVCFSLYSLSAKNKPLSPFLVDLI